MRLNAVGGTLFCLAVCSFAQAPQSSQKTGLSAIGQGALSGSNYVNDDLGISFRLPHDWAAKINPDMGTLFSPDQDAPANRCTRILLEYDSKPGDSTAKGVVFVIDPDCLKIGPFPAAEANEDELAAFNRSMLEIYQRSTFFPPSGVQLYAFKGAGDKGRLFLGMAGSAQVQPPGGEAGVKREPVAVNTLFVVVEADKYWAGWAIVADDKAKDEFAKESRMTVK